MSLWEILDTIVLKSLELVFEVAYMMAYKIIGDPGLSIIVLSLFMNFLVLPLYLRADAIQKEEHALEGKLQKGINHIKRTFHGDERMMILQTFYRQSHYKPVYVLRSAVSLLLQIPFFIAAYRFLSELSLLNGHPFGPISDLGSPDGLLQIGGVNIHVLPIIMTAVNLITCIIFTKGSPLKGKIQIYAMALFFLVFLYNSPAGLVFYWTLNNVFSLVKTIFYKMKDPRKILRIAFSGSGIFVAIYGLFIYHPSTVRKAVFIAGVAVLLQVPIVYGIMRQIFCRLEKVRSSYKNRITDNRRSKTENRKLFLLGGIFLSVLTGALIPSSVIKASPLEFIDITSFYHPIWFMVSSLCLASGIFVFWAGIFYSLAKTAVRVYFDRVVWVLSGVFIVNYMFFGRDIGLITKNLIYENKLEFTRMSQLVNALVVVVTALALYVLHRYREKLATEVLMAGVLALTCMTAGNVVAIDRAVSELETKDIENYEEIPRFTLSKTGKNVIVLMLDQAAGKYMPYFIEEKPELKEQFAGFTYYANTVSFGAHTNFGTPALFGGYEYTPAEINKRSEESLAAKHDEALKVMPVMFEENGYQVMVCDPPLAGYQWIPDLSIYDDYSGIKHYILAGKFTDDSIKQHWIEDNKRNFFCYGILKAAPLCFQKTIYDYGRYNQEENVKMEMYTTQRSDTLYTSYGLRAAFMDSYNELSAYSGITDAVEEDINTFLMLVNGVTHDPMLLQEPEYVPAVEVDNSEYEREHQDRYTAGGQTLPMTTGAHAVFYQSNMAAMLQLGKWFDYMRENGVYENTRIIIVADHGRTTLYEGDEHRLGDRDIDSFYPLLMVKDFGDKEFTISEEFMTNGDVPTLALDGIVDNPINPFTGNRIDSSDKKQQDQYIIESEKGNIEENNGNTFLPSKWYSVHDDMRDVDNWKLLSEEETILPPIENEESQ